MAADVLGCLIIADALEGDDKCVPDQSELPENRDYVSLTVHVDRTEGQVLPGVLHSKDSKESVRTPQKEVRVEPDGDCNDVLMNADAKKNVKGPRRVEPDCVAEEGQEQIAGGHLQLRQETSS
eukprot:Em0017g228a